MNEFRGLIAACILALGVSSAFAGSITVVSNDNRLGTLNDVTGVYTQTGTLPGEKSAGVASMNGLLYLEDTDMVLFSIDPISGASHAIGSTGMDDDSFGTFGGGPGGLFEVGSDSNLYSISATTGRTTLIGATGLGKIHNQDTSLSLNGNTLYYTLGSSGARDELYRISTTTGVAADLGSTGVTGISGSAFVNGRLELYQYGHWTNYLYSAPAGSVNFAQGPALTTQILNGGTVINSASSVGSGQVTSAAPEPGSLLLAGSGLILFLIGGRARTRRQDSTYR